MYLNENYIHRYKNLNKIISIRTGIPVPVPVPDCTGDSGTGSSTSAKFSSGNWVLISIDKHVRKIRPYQNNQLPR